MKAIVFLDRDGTLIEEVGYIRDPSDVRILPGAVEALRLLTREGCLLAVVSNQAGLAKGMFTGAEMEAVHRRFVSVFEAEKIVFDAIEYCPHHPEGTMEAYRRVCECRKPGTALAEEILRQLRVPESCPRFVVGDKMSDISMGVRLGASTVLVGTGYGFEEKASGERVGIIPNVFLPGLVEAAGWIVAHVTRT